MSELQHYYDMCRQGAFARNDADECGCRGHGWFLSEVDTWHECPVHYAGQRHPEDDRSDEEFAADEAAAHAAREAEPVPAMLDTDCCDDNDIPF